MTEPPIERRHSLDSTQDPPLLSLVRGRLLAAVSSALQVWVALAGLAVSWLDYRADGATADLAARVMTHTEHLFDGAALLAAAAFGLVSLAASLASKRRDKRPTRSGRAGPC